MNYRYIILGITLLSYGIRADFIAYQKLIHPQDKHVVHLLYDNYATIENPVVTNKQKQLYSLWETARFLNIFDYVNLFDHVRKESCSLRKQLPNLTQQHNDLLSLIKQHDMSLIAPDQIADRQEIGLLTMGKFSTFDKYCVKNLGFPRKIGKDWNNLGFPSELEKGKSSSFYRECATPLFGIGFTLTGKEITCRNMGEYYHKISGANGYYCNTTTNYGSPGTHYFLNRHNPFFEYEHTQTMLTLNKLFSLYQQRDVIIAQDYMYAAKIARDLIEKEGYRAEPMVIADTLTQLKPQHPCIDAFFTALSLHHPFEYTAEMDDFYLFVANHINVQTVLNNK